MRAASESQLLDTAVAEMGELTKIVVAELEKNLQLQLDPWLASAGSFLKAQIPGSPEGLPKQLNVRVAASDLPYPTIASLVQDMQTRRDTAENLARQRILELELKLLKAWELFDPYRVYRNSFCFFCVGQGRPFLFCTVPMLAL